MNELHRDPSTSSKSDGVLMRTIEHFVKLAVDNRRRYPLTVDVPAMNLDSPESSLFQCAGKQFLSRAVTGGVSVSNRALAHQFATLVFGGEPVSAEQGRNMFQGYSVAFAGWILGICKRHDEQLSGRDGSRQDGKLTDETTEGNGPTFDENAVTSIKLAADFPQVVRSRLLRWSALQRESPEAAEIYALADFCGLYYPEIKPLIRCVDDERLDVDFLRAKRAVRGGDTNQSGQSTTASTTNPT